MLFFSVLPCEGINVVFRRKRANELVGDNTTLLVLVDDALWKLQNTTKARDLYAEAWIDNFRNHRNPIPLNLFLITLRRGPTQPILKDHLYKNKNIQNLANNYPRWSFDLFESVQKTINTSAGLMNSSICSVFMQLYRSLMMQSNISISLDLKHSVWFHFYWHFAWSRPGSLSHVGSI